MWETQKSKEAITKEHGRCYGRIIHQDSHVATKLCTQPRLVNSSKAFPGDKRGRESWRNALSYPDKRRWVDMQTEAPFREPPPHSCLLQIPWPLLLLTPSGQRVGDHSFPPANLRVLDYPFFIFKNPAQPFVNSPLLNSLSITQSVRCVSCPDPDSFNTYIDKDWTKSTDFTSLPDSPSSQSPSKEV